MATDLSGTLNTEFIFLALRMKAGKILTTFFVVATRRIQFVAIRVESKFFIIPGLVNDGFSMRAILQSEILPVLSSY